MHPLHEYIATQIAEKLRTKKIVVWYDARREFTPFVREVSTGSVPGVPVQVSLAGTTATFAEYDGSFFQIRSMIEPYIAGDVPESVVVYVSGCERDRHGSVLMEIERPENVMSPSSSVWRETSFANDTRTE